MIIVDVGFPGGFVQPVTNHVRCITISAVFNRLIAAATITFRKVNPAATI